MSVNKNTSLGKITISSKAIASVVANAALECYGVVGLSSKSALAEKIQNILSNGEYTKGVSVDQDKSSVTINLYLVISLGVKVTEVLSEVQKKVRFVVGKTFAINVKKVNVYAVHLRKIN